MPKAAPSTRSSGNVTLSFGLISAPLVCYSGTVSDHGIRRNNFVVTPDGDHPVGNMNYDKVTGEPLPAETEIVQKIKTDWGPVYVEDSEIEALFEIAPDSLVVKEFEPQANFHAGHFIPKGLLHLEPRKVGSGAKKGYDPAAVKVFTILLRALKAKNAMAICELTTRGIPKPAVLMPDGRLWLIYHTDATREQRELPKPPETGIHSVSDAEVAAMGMFVDSMFSQEPLDFVDERSQLIQDLADEKAEAGQFDKPEEVATVAAPAATGGVDFMALLQASVDAAKGTQAA